MSIDHVSAAYSARAQHYVAAVGKIEHVDERDREFVRAWARQIQGQILDVGCGPGQWTAYLSAQGAEVQGIDPVAAFIERAEADYPAARYRQGCAEDLAVPDNALGGILAWFSLIHTDPDDIAGIVAEFARALQPGGTVLIGFFAGPSGSVFDHAITTAYYWTPDAWAELLERAGFVVRESWTRTEVDARPCGAIVAEMSAVPSDQVR
ncbi:class I SAM-dependent methyltransferase [Leucobacter luti]|uniref:class I SAM-dependent methyltransferase n=1 Tax=Leucobacter luti TaxID=340320 RepID=UPI001C68DCFE|nr:class I SAM-dependent methyltransferase [Leucobacter luti]QYM75373.1 class I SAM-dependent methyltransferase [Leucobacter luti]